MAVRIPMVPLSPRAAKRVGTRFRGIGARFVKPHSPLHAYMKQAGIEMSAAEFMGLAFFTAVFYAAISGVAVGLVEFRFNGTVTPLSPLIGLLMFAMGFAFVTQYPKLFVIRIARATDRNMLSAMRHLLVEVRSGVPLFDAMAGITKGYSQVSVEFEKIVKEINAGVNDIEALNRAASRNTSLFFRRAVWQLVNSIRGGSDIGDTMEAITDSFAKSQAVRIRQYGQELNPWTMMYMIVAIILPSLGITFLVVLSSFSGVGVPSIIFPMIVLFLILFQFFFMGFIKKKRPNVSI